MRTCPRCVIELKAARGPVMTVDMCTECGGAYFDHGELAKLARKQAESLGKLEDLVDPEPDSSPVVRDRQVPCPGCGQPMEGYEYSYCSGIMLDRCLACSGVWVDEGELQAIADHAKRGDKMTGRDCRRVAPFFAAKARNMSVEALAGMLTRNPRDTDWL